MVRETASESEFTARRPGYRPVGTFLVRGGTVLGLYAFVQGYLIAREPPVLIIVAVCAVLVPIGARMRDHGVAIDRSRVRVVTMFRRLDVNAQEVVDVTAERVLPFLVAPTLHVLDRRPFPVRMLAVDRYGEPAGRRLDHRVGEMRRILFRVPNPHASYPPLTARGRLMFAAVLVVFAAAVSVASFVDSETIRLAAMAGGAVAALALQKIGVTQRRRDPPPG